MSFSRLCTIMALWHRRGRHVRPVWTTVLSALLLFLVAFLLVHHSQKIHNSSNRLLYFRGSAEDQPDPLEPKVVRNYLEEEATEEGENEKAEKDLIRVNRHQITVQGDRETDDGIQETEDNIHGHTPQPVSLLTTVYDPLSHPDRFRFIHSRKQLNLTGPKTNLIPEQVRWRHDLTHVCPKSDRPFILALVVSALKETERRAFVRATWGNPVWYPHSRLRAVFVLGETLDSALQDAVDQEAAIHNDIIQYTFIDSYANLTYKTLSLLTWSASHCPDVPFVAKIDDDVMVNPFHLWTFFKEQLNNPPEPKGVKEGDEVMEVPAGANKATTYIYGRYDPVPYPLRSTKWAVSKVEYPEKSFPPFVHGPAYVVGSAAVQQLLKYAPYVPFVKLEDVYTTGLVAHAAGVKHVQINGVINTFVINHKLFNGTQAFLEETSLNTKKKAWDGILQYAPHN
ncbi:beta-1,3-galactosyltransferase 9-like [Homarus americanus]|uniref:Hexosyltransferase n=1 Tax=Homarus americanus TaxID=6706 RepID=A0A8J5MXS2_HOMAM|nr:beta-1,3-galactosyltransferase 9-like [Homarus americanus]KAG7168350.1 Beta-1-3-galactosyltransferase 5-like 1 [Homarus americanus]